MSGAGFVAWAVESLVASTLLMAAVLLLRGTLRRVAGAQIAYALWALPVLRLVLPPLPHGPVAIATPVSQAGETLAILVAPAAAPTVATQPFTTIPVALILFAIWAVGAVSFVLWHTVSHRRFCRRIVRGAVSIEAIDGVRIIESATAPGPIAFGIVDRYVAFPIGIADRYDADERALALAHELGHHARGDLIANWIALVVLAVHWFNPVAWRAFRAFRADQELANDARVLAGRSAADRHIYACAIVKAAHGGAVSAVCHLHTITDLKGRLKMLTTTPASRRRLMLGATTVGALVIAGLGLTASGSSAAAISASVPEAVAPIAPAIPPAPPEPTIGLATATDTGSTTLGSNGHRKVKRIVMVRDGHPTSYEGRDADAYITANPDRFPSPPVPGGSRMIVTPDSDRRMLIEVQSVPAIHSAKCGIGTGKPSSMVIDSGKGEKRMIVICTDRIEKVKVDALVSMQTSGAMERTAYAQGLTGLATARQKVVADITMSDPDRARALSAIDQSITEMKRQLSRMD